jgi:ADP-heptose:LPS heptosyltransferase
VEARFARRYRAQSAAFRAFDSALGLALGRPGEVAPGSLPAPRRLLLADYGHLGDILITLSLLPGLARALPDTEIGLLCGSWNRAVVEDEPLLAHVHHLDHWFLDRSAASRAHKLRAFRRDLRRVVGEVRAVGYDTAVDCRPWFPNAIPVLRRAGIPTRVGYDRVGFAPMLTGKVPFRYDATVHEREHHAAPLRALPVGDALDQLPAAWARAGVDGGEVLARHHPDLQGRRYAVLHPGASTEVRDWNEDGWAEVARRTVADGVVPVITGLGDVQDAVARRLVDRVQGAVSLSSRLQWRELVGLIAGASVVYSVETSVGHLAGALGTPCVAVYGGMQNPLQWQPLGNRVELVTHELSCSPCFQREGCSHLSCLQGITADEVWIAGRKAQEP